jgi:nucleotide-binding universal stress UspA family protein
MSSLLNIRRILVPVDFSAASEQALRHATALAAHFGGKITLVHVIESGRYSDLQILRPG